MTSIFDRLFWYRQSEGKTPKEDYVTETLVAILEKVEGLKVSFVKYLICGEGNEGLEVERVYLQTQKTFWDVRRRPDIYVEAREVERKRHLLFIENKIDAPEGVRQLDDYMKLLKNERTATSRTLVYITRRSQKPDNKNIPSNVRFIHLRWFEVYNWLKRWNESQSSDGVVGRSLLTEFLTLMEDWHMGGEIDAASLRAAVRYHGSLNSGWRLVEEMIDPAWSESDIDSAVGKTSGNWIYNTWACWQTSPKIQKFSDVRIAMGFRFGRQDDEWNVDEIELPSAAVTIKGSSEVDFPRPSRKWKKGPLEGMDTDDLWIRQVSEKPSHGESMCEFYREFFLSAFAELRKVIAEK